jgi:diguanylate cyclase (GGDEF)-like protein
VSVCDTGVGISKQNIGKLFNKFIQVGRTNGPGEKGTGLGLAICKGLVDLHGGRIWVESAPGKGSKFHFVIPRVSYEEVFREYVKSGITESQDKEKPFSILVSRIDNFAELKKKYGMVKPYALLSEMAGAIKNSLRRASDVALKNSGECAALLPETNKHGVVAVEQRARKALAKLLLSKQMEKEVQVSFGNSTYPEDALERIEMIARARASFEGMYFGSERRKDARVYTRLHIELAPRGAASKKGRAQSVNISRGGLCVFSNTALPVGAKIDMDIRLPQRGDLITATASVIWVKKVDNVAGFRYKIGVKYDSIDSGRLNEVMNFVSGLV